MKIALLFGPSGSGKTTAAVRCADEAKNRGWHVGGIVAPGTFRDNCRQEFQVIDLASGEQRLLCSRGLAAAIHCGPFGFSPIGLEFGKSAILRAIASPADLLVIDEIGPLELRNMGWAEVLRAASTSKVRHLLFTVRPTLCQEVCRTFFAEDEICWLPVAESANLWQHWR